MAYTLDGLYQAISSSQRTVGNYQMSEEREWGAGSISFLNKENKGRYLQIYASPAWEQCDGGFEEVISEPRLVAIAFQLEALADDGWAIDTTFADDIPLLLTGILQADIDAYFEAVRVFFSAHNVDAVAN